MTKTSLTRRRFAKGLSAAGLLAGTAPFTIARAQGGPLKIGVILPLSGVQAGVGQSCKRGVDVAPALLKQNGYTKPSRSSPSIPKPMSMLRAPAPSG